MLCLPKLIYKFHLAPLATNSRCPGDMEVGVLLSISPPLEPRYNLTYSHFKILLYQGLKKKGSKLYLRASYRQNIVMNIFGGKDLPMPM